MKKGTVVLGIEEYNELREYKQVMEGKHTLIIGSGWSFHRKRFITTEKAVEEIAEVNAFILKEKEALQSETKRLTDSLNSVKKMSYWQFRKWRKS